MISPREIGLPSFVAGRAMEVRSKESETTGRDQMLALRRGPVSAPHAALVAAVVTGIEDTREGKSV